MLSLILGRSGSGKTEYVRNLLGEQAKQGNDKLLLIVPEQFSYSSERALLEKYDADIANRIEVVSFSRLVDYVNRQIGGLSNNYADDSAKLILMLKTLNILSTPENEDKLEFYKKHVNSIPLARQLLHLITEFYMQKVTPSNLLDASKSLDGTLSKKVQELSLIYNQYDALLSNKYTNDGTALDDLCTIASKTNFFSGYTIAIDAFKGFTAQEYAVLELLFKQADCVYLSLCTDCKAKSLDTSMIFDSVDETLSRIKRIAKDLNIEIADTIQLSNQKRFKTEELSFLEENAFSASAETFNKESNNIQLCVAETKRSECNYIAATIRKLLRKDGIRLSDIAIIVRDEASYNRELVAAFNRFEIPVFEDVRQPITNQPIISLTRSILRILCNGFTNENILNYLKTGLSPLSLEEISEIENYTLIWNTPAIQWRQGFAKENSPAGLKEINSERQIRENEEKFLELNEMRAKVITPLLFLEKCIKDDISAIKVSEALYTFLLDTDVPTKLKEYASFLNEQGFSQLAEEQDRVWDILMTILDRIATVYGEDKITIKTYIELFDAVVSITNLGNIPHGLDEVIIGSADRIRLNSPKVVFLAGCAEGIFPATINSSGLLSNAERRQLSEKADLSISLPVEQLAAEERFIAYMALSSASEQLYVSYHQTSGANESLSPSIIYNTVAKLFKTEKIDSKEIIHQIETSKQEYDYLAETKESTFLAFAESIPKASTDEWEKLNTMREVLKSDSAYESKFNAIDKIIKHEPQSLSPDKATTLFKKNMYLSASQIETFYKCKFKYFCQYGLYAYPREKAELSPAISGTVIHYVLENIIKEANGKENLIKYDKNQRQATIKKWLKEYIDTYFYGTEGKPARFLYLYDKLEVHLIDILDRLCKEFELTDFEPCDFELPLTNDRTKGGLEPYHIDLGDGNGSIDIRGSVDRVDKFVKDGTTYIRVIDYKSGGKDFKLSEILYGINMQMLIYLFAIENNGKEYYNSNIESAGILYYPAQRATISADRKDKDIFADKAKEDRENGLYRSDEFILEAMEHGQNGIFIPVLDYYNRPVDALVTLTELGRIKKQVEEEIREMGTLLHNGNIEVKPIYNSDYDNACKWCNYHSICGFEEGDPIIEMESKKTREVLEELLKEDGDSNVD
ncbi:MAG: PD-(D/E)XK nuclease family protein [Oscillospiraceae bacterium]|nr:PD-(D/E)XK nuclease family protein [Candidatus Limimonas egerieequi]